MKKLFTCLASALLLTWILPSRLPAGECGLNYLCQEALVKFSRRLNPADIARLLNDKDATVLAYFPRTRLYHLSFPSQYETQTWVKNFRQQAGVLVAASNDLVWGQALPDDPSFDLLWGLKNTGQTGGLAGTDIDIESVWDETQDGSGIVVAMIDSGVDYNHPDLAANIWVNPGEIPGNGIDDEGNGFVDDVHGYDFANQDGDPMDDNDHGTHVTGIVGAVGNNGIGVTGVAWSAKIMAVKFLDENSSGSAANAIAAIEYALANGAKILNNSWGSSSFNQGLKNALLEADSQGVLAFVAAGNQARDIDVTPFYPASLDLPNIVTLASIDDEDELSSFSSFGSLSVDLAAPGGSVYSTKPNNTYGYISGTSMATPYAAGAAALLWSRFPGLSHRQIRNLVLQGREPRSYLTGVTVMGGLLNVANSLDIALNPGNQIPEAYAGPDQSLELGHVVHLNGTALDADGDFPLSFYWEFSAPADSKSQLNSYYSQNPSFIPDREGEYIATLIVSDSLNDSIPDSVKVTIAGGSLPLPNVVIRAFYKNERGLNQAIGSGMTVPIGASVSLRGNESSSLFPEALLYAWEIVAQPEGAQVELSETDHSMSDLLADQAGTYTIRLRVEDGYNENFGELSFVAAEAGNPLPPSDPLSPSLPSTGGCSLNIHR